MPRTCLCPSTEDLTSGIRQQQQEGLEAFPAAIHINKYAAALTDTHIENVSEISAVLDLTVWPSSPEHTVQANATNLLLPRCFHCLSSGCASPAHRPNCDVELRFKAGLVQTHLCTHLPISVIAGQIQSSVAL